MSGPARKAIRKKSSPCLDEIVKAAALSDASSPQKVAPGSPDAVRTPEAAKGAGCLSPETARRGEPEALQPVFKALEASVNYEKVSTTAEMLLASLPYAMLIPEGAAKRHPYQEAILTAVATHLRQFRTHCKAEITASQRSLAKIENERAYIGDEVSAARTKTLEAEGRRSEAEANLQKADDALTVVQEPLKEVEGKATAARNSRDGLQKEKEDSELALDDLWGPLKDADFEVTGQQRYNMMRKLMTRVKKTDAEEALLDALPVALKMKPAARGKHAQLTMEFGEEAHRQHLHDLPRKIEAAVTELEACQKAVEKAELPLAAARSEHLNAFEAFKAVDSAHAAASKAEAELRGKADGVDPRKRELEEAPKKIQAEIASLEEALSVLADFKQTSALSAVHKALADIKVR